MVASIEVTRRVEAAARIAPVKKMKTIGCIPKSGKIFKTSQRRSRGKNQGKNATLAPNPNEVLAGNSEMQTNAALMPRR